MSTVAIGAREQRANDRDATTLTIREHLADVALQYDKLADGAEAGYREQELLADQA
jgi:hypothetical protein